ncbi:MAG: hypothetical protein PHI96_09290 [Desulfovibrio sp.]|nr:hypothetical protein [Desulfovibrio sp.]
MKVRLFRTSGIVWNSARALCMLTLLACPAFADPMTEIRANVERFRESYDQAVPVSGSAIVGLRLGESSESASVRSMYLVPPPDMDVCVRVITRDGRFSASNIYTYATPEQVRQAATGDKVRLSPITLRYADVLSAYGMDDLAFSSFSARVGACMPEISVYLPQVASPDMDWKTLTVLINSGGRYSRILLRSGKYSVPCRGITKGAHIAFDQKCVIDATLLAGGVNALTLVLDDGFGDERIDFKVAVPVVRP